MKRRLWMVAAVVLGALPSVAFGQTGTFRDYYAHAMYSLGSETDNYLTLTGTETSRGIDTALYSVVALHRYIDPSDFSVRSYLEYKSYRNSVLQRRIVADGLHVWSYNAIKNEYSSWTYDRASDDKNRDWEAASVNMLRSARRQAVGLDDIMFATLLDANEARSGIARLIVQWNPWIPTATVSLENKYSIRATSSTPRYSTMLYSIGLDTELEYHLYSIDEGETQVPDGGGVKTTRWSVDVATAITDPAVSYRFDPGNAKPVSVGIPQSAGG